MTPGLGEAVDVRFVAGFGPLARQLGAEVMPVGLSSFAELRNA